MKIERKDGFEDVVVSSVRSRNGGIWERKFLHDREFYSEWELERAIERSKRMFQDLDERVEAPVLECQCGRFIDPPEGWKLVPDASM